MLIDLLDKDISTRRLMLEGQPVHLRRIDGSTDLVESDQVRITDWIRLVALEEVEHAPDSHRAQQALRNLTLKEETLASAAARLLRNL